MLTRFAPAPTGWLHLGHVLNAEYVWGRARAESGRVLLRIEDHDRTRARPEFEAGILDDLDWLGYRPDVYPTEAFRRGRCGGRQSDRDPIYREALEILRAKGLVYGCNCSRQSTATGSWQTVGPARNPVELHYPGTCRNKNHPLIEGYGWRVRMDHGIEEFEDLMVGIQAQDPAEQCGDVLIRDRHGNWTYQFAVTVDDWRQEVDVVIRGIDLLPSTGRQIRIARLLGRHRPPRFVHHPLIMKTLDQKLSKSDRDSGVRDLRARGWTPADVIQAALENARK